VCQAIGAAMLQANSVALIAHAVPRTQLARALGVQAAAQAVGLALGPSVGGVLLQIGDWRTIFWINVPIGIVALALGWLLLPREPRSAGCPAVRLVGTALFLPAVACTLARSVSRAEMHIGSRGAVALLAAGAPVFAIAFVAWEQRARYPVVDLALLRDRTFSLD